MAALRLQLRSADPCRALSSPQGAVTVSVADSLIDITYACLVLLGRGPLHAEGQGSGGGHGDHASVERSSSRRWVTVPDPVDTAHSAEAEQA